jgi:hypothetical protein
MICRTLPLPELLSSMLEVITASPLEAFDMYADEAHRGGPQFDG